MEIVEKKLSELKPYKNNPKRHSKKQIERIANSLEEFGRKQAIVIDADNTIVAGHCRYLAAKKLKYKTAPCIIADDLTEEQIRAYRLLDNRLSENDYDLSIEFAEMQDIDFDFEPFGIDIDDFSIENEADEEPTNLKQDNDRSMQNDAFENQEYMQFPCNTFYGIPELQATQTTGDKFLRFMDWKEIEDYENYIAHFYYDDYKFMSAYREPEKYLDRLKRFKAVVSPDFSLYTDFPRALQILSCYRRNWCGAFWQYHGIDVIPDVVWGDEQSFEYCFDGLPKGGTVAVSSVGVKLDKEWNNKQGDMFKRGYDEMMRRLEPTTILFYGDMIDGLEGNIIRIPSFYEQKREMLNERKKAKNGKRKQ